ncbi:MAG: recombination protein RecR [Deltaproteobacteria bacterium]|nr:recombination protein RecR [Deltaproteobacteria bacterium]
MDDTSDPVQDLVRALVKLPSVGEKSARRIVQHLLTADPTFAEALGARIAALPRRVRRCEVCGTFTARVRCGPCADPGRLATVLCVVARPSDSDAIERTRAFRGRYHVLHALLDPLGGVGPAEFPLGALLARVRAEGVEEVIVATPPTVEGEATALYLAESLRAAGVQVSRIASGVPHGGDLEYTDPITLGRALEGRRTL